MRWLWAILLFSIVDASFAKATTCEELMAAHRAPLPKGRMINPPSGFMDCSLAEARTFILNENAVAEAVPVTELDKLHGTWLGDDEWLSMMNITNGQEVLRLGPAESGDLIAFEQLWYTAVRLPNERPLWDEEGNYAGWVSRGVLKPNVTDGTFSEAFVGGVHPDYAFSINYSGREFTWPRSLDLLIGNWLNYFERPVSFALSGDTLVVTYEISDPLLPLARGEKGHSTFSRVDPEAPELALSIIEYFELSHRAYFDCLTHELSDGESRLHQMLEPHGLDKVARFVREVFRAREAMRASLERVKFAKDLSQSETDIASFEMSAARDLYFQLIKSPEMDAIEELSQSTLMVCPPPGL
jgi:hypothetical protein